MDTNTVFSIQTCTLPSAVQADILHIPNVNQPLYKRALGDVKYQMAMQDTLGNDDAEEKKIVNMLDLNSNSDLVRGVYEGNLLDKMMTMMDMLTCVTW